MSLTLLYRSVSFPDTLSGEDVQVLFLHNNDEVTFFDD